MVTNTKADTIIRFMQTQIANHRVPQNVRCDQAQGFRAKKFMLYCNNNNIKLIFAPVDDHRSIGMVERLIRTLKSRLSVMKIDKRNVPYKLASDVAEHIKTLTITPNDTTKITPFEAQFGQKPNTPSTAIDRQLIEKFIIGAHLPSFNIPYNLINEKRKFLKQKPKNDIAQLRTRKPIRTLTKQEKQNIEKGTYHFPKGPFLRSADHNQYTAWSEI